MEERDGEKALGALSATLHMVLPIRECPIQTHAHLSATRAEDSSGLTSG